MAHKRTDLDRIVTFFQTADLAEAQTALDAAKALLRNRVLESETGQAPGLKPKAKRRPRKAKAEMPRLTPAESRPLM